MYSFGEADAVARETRFRVRARPTGWMSVAAGARRERRRFMFVMAAPQTSARGTQPRRLPMGYVAQIR